MSKMGKYCKAYLLKQFRQFDGWKENTDNIKKDTQEVDGETVEVIQKLTDDDVLYLQENYFVTDGIYKDENVIFENVTDEWKEFCNQVLEFEIPSRGLAC